MTSPTTPTAPVPGPSRRSLIAGAALAVVGWNVADAVWTTAPASAAEPDVAAVPDLDGTLELAVPARFSRDFGGFVEARPWAVLHAGSEADVAAMLRFAQENRITVAANGQSGEDGEQQSHSNHGQALTRGGLQIDMSAFRGLKVSGTKAVVGAGTSWAQLVDAALERGRTVPSLPDYLHLSIGGTVAVGGIGGSVQRHGLQADLVRAGRFVTGTGEVVQARGGRRRDVLDLARAGAGQVAVTTELEIQLVKARELARITHLHYPDLPAYLDDQQRALRSKLFDHQSGEIVRNAAGDGWEYRLELGCYVDRDRPVRRVEELLAGMGDDASRRVTQTLPYRDWVFRVDAFVAALREGGYLSQRKPWLSLLLPGAEVRRFVEEMVADLTPRDLGAGFCLLSPLDPSRISTPAFVLPRGDQVYFLDLLCFPAPGDDGIEGMLERNRRLYDRAVGLGGKRYLIGAIPGMTPDDWRRHFGDERYAALRKAKEEFDPAGVLTPGQGFFAGEGER
ncbi:FAD-binding protein [Kineococcus sp. SYSU DK018]|uniref:FAD-binding protein n=1 Tax=Kineococcus sp. SYSU DK018 TaxID=3383139 RepID=UPI003D7CB803